MPSEGQFRIGHAGHDNDLVVAETEFMECVDGFCGARGFVEDGH